MLHSARRQGDPAPLLILSPAGRGLEGQGDLSVLVASGYQFYFSSPLITADMTKIPKRLSAKLWRPQAHRAERNRAMLLLRFGCAAPAPGQRPLRNYQDIARAFCVSPQLARKVCLDALGGSAGGPKPKDPRKQLERQHIKYLLQHYTLKRWIGRSLDERAALFMRKFPDKELTGGRLWHLYRKHGIKYKCVAVKKMAAADKADQIREETLVAYD